MADPLPSRLVRLPLIGRSTELQMVRSLLERARAGRGGTLVLRGPSGVGKSRLLQAASEEAARSGWRSALGRAYPVVSGIPYAPFADAFFPVLRELSANATTHLLGDAERELAYLFPTLRPPPSTPERPEIDSGELKTRLLFGFTRFLERLSATQPLLLVLDDLQWADASSLELLHFLARQIGTDRIALLCAYNDSPGEQTPRLRAVERSLSTQEDVSTRVVAPLSLAECAALIQDVFELDDGVAGEFAALLYGWTRGNPYFLEEILKSMVQSGLLYREEGAWAGWDAAEIGLPSSLRDAVLERLTALSASARVVAELMSVIGTDITHSALRAVSALGEEELVRAVDELRSFRALEERLEGEAVVYDFPHPVLRETLYGELGLARAELLHTRVAEALEACYGADADRHADALAYHFARSRAPDHAARAIHYLCTAGRAALEKYADREAADYLSTALQRATDSGTTEVPPRLLEDLARARQRLGDFEGAAELLQRTRQAALDAGSSAGVAAAERRLGLVRYWGGRPTEALEHYENGLGWASRAGDGALYARLRLAQGDCLIELGRPADARECIEEALPVAEQLGDPALKARVHLALLLLHTWTGPPERAWAHGKQTLALAEQSGNRSLCCTTHWALTILAGLTGNPAATARHISACTQLADELRSPLHRLRATELAVEYAAKTGDWETGIALGERAIASARALGQRALLARLLVWTALIHIGRGDLPRGRRYVDEAWSLSGADGSDGPLDVHTVVPAHCGRAAYLVAAGELEAAVEVGMAGLGIAERTGYTVWAVHRLLPVVAEAYVSKGDLVGAARIGARLRRDSEGLGHQLGLAWADACDGFLVWLGGDIGEGIERLRGAAERLESIHVLPDAARLRRHLAARLRDHGRREEALGELRRVHEVFVGLGAAHELDRTREQIRELGARPPAREVPRGVAGLSARELEIGRLVAAGKSNKAIAKQLEISVRTVGTHLTNIFRKLQVDSRSQLADALWRMELIEEPVHRGP